MGSGQSWSKNPVKWRWFVSLLNRCLKARIELETGAAPVVVSGIPALARTTFGIEFDHIAIGSLMNQVRDELGEVAAAVEFDAAEDDDDDDELPESL